MISTKDLKAIARARLRDAHLLLRAKRFDGAFYLCGYAVELALKARICRTLKWAGFPGERIGDQRYAVDKDARSGPPSEVFGSRVPRKGEAPGRMVDSAALDAYEALSAMRRHSSCKHVPATCFSESLASTASTRRMASSRTVSLFSEKSNRFRNRTAECACS